MSIKHREIMKVVKEKDLEKLNNKLKGIEGVATDLETNTTQGIPDDEKKIAQRRKKFGSNTYTKKPRPKGFLRSVWRPLQAFAILNNFANTFAAFILFLAAYGIGSCIPSAHKSKVIINEDEMEVLRGGKRKKISKSEIVVGDVVCLKIGDKVPADGLFLKGDNLQLVIEDGERISESSSGVSVNEMNPFLFSGSQVVDGYGGCQMMVTSVGMKAKWCEMMSQHSRGGSSHDEEIATVEDQVYELSCSIRNKVGLPIALLGFLVLLARYFTGNTKDYQGNREFNDGDHRGSIFYSSVLEFLVTVFNTVVVVIPESLRLGVALTIFYSKKRMMADMEMVMSDLSLSGCETMGSVTTICTDKTGTLTINQMKVTEFWVGNHVLGKEANYLSNASDSFKKLLEEGIALNTSYARNTTPTTDKAILSWAVHDLDMNMEVKTRCRVLQYAAFDSRRKRSGVLMEREGDNTVCVHRKGEAEVILEMCSSYYDISGNIKDLVDAEKVEFKRIIQGMKESNLHCIAFAHNNIVIGDDPAAANEPTLKEDGLVLLALVGIKDPCRPEMREAVKDCRNSGVDVKIITGDDVSEAKDIARECGILLHTDDDEDGAVITGEAFRNYSQKEREEKVDKIKVMANSSPDHKLLLVKTLKKRDRIVAVSGNSTNDVLVLLEADVGISMGIKAGTDVVKKISDIVILDDNFASVAGVLKSSICIYNNMQKCLQFQLTLNIAALAIIFISAVSAGEIPLHSGHVLWLNLIVSTLASLALATEKPTQEPIKRQPVGRKEPLISNTMLRNLLAQVVYQIVVVLTLLFKAESVLDLDFKGKNALIFHAFLLSQVFNEFNARNLVKKNVFKGIHRDKLFLVFIAITISVQVMFWNWLHFILNPDDYFESLDLRQWGICFGIGFISLPIGCVVKCIPVPEKPAVLCYLGLV